jgi:hypothetical protein
VKWSVKSRKHVRGILGAIAIYVGFYVVLSLCGTYSSVPVASGKMRLVDGGLAIRDVYVWEPKWVLLRPYDINFLGAFFWGPLRLDRAFWHKNMPVYSEGFRRENLPVYIEDKGGPR